jgi:hypothetical protein
VSVVPILRQLPTGKLIQQKPEYPCHSCGEFFTGDQLEEVPWFDRQNGEEHILFSARDWNAKSQRGCCDK